MFEFLKKLWIAYYRLVLGCSAVILIIAAIGAVLNFAWLAAQGRVDEVATAYISMATFGALVAFGVWVPATPRRPGADSRSISRRIPPRPMTQKRTTRTMRSRCLPSTSVPRREPTR